jgi:hypothetical protein
MLLLTIIPFGMFGIACAISNSGLGISLSIQSILFVISFFAMFVLTAVGWVNNFPRWSIPALGFCLFISLYFMKVTVPALKSDPLGYWAMLPLLVTWIVSLMFKFKFEPVKQLIKQIKEEPVLILFALYGCVPFFIFLLYDEMHSIGFMSVILFSILIFSLGLYIFLRSNSKKTRIISIIASGLSVLIIAFAVNFFFW